MRIPIVLAVALLTATTASAAEDSTSKPMRDAIAVLKPLVGAWTGSGWMQLPDGRHQEFMSRETVTERLDGAALLIEGYHTAPPVNAAEPPRVVHNVLAVLAYDPSKRLYRFRSTLADGQMGDYEGRVEASRFIWTMATPQGHMEYVIDYSSPGTWQEIGRFSVDGQTWRQVFEMTLTKQDR